MGMESDARIPDHCGWSARGRWKEAYGAACDEIARLTAEVERLTKGSICEVAATNPSVMEYMRHWEGRAEKAEAEVEHMRTVLNEIKIRAINALHRKERDG